jgi:hypothetical protein
MGVWQGGKGTLRWGVAGRQGHVAMGCGREARARLSSGAEPTLTICHMVYGGTIHYRGWPPALPAAQQVRLMNEFW